MYLLIFDFIKIWNIFVCFYSLIGYSVPWWFLKPARFFLFCFVFLIIQLFHSRLGCTRIPFSSTAEKKLSPLMLFKLIFRLLQTKSIISNLSISQLETAPFKIPICYWLWGQFYFFLFSFFLIFIVIQLQLPAFSPHPSTPPQPNPPPSPLILSMCPL